MDRETGMYYYGARYYDPRISIFISVDPLAEETMEPYLYTGNNPIMFTDPTGMSKDGIETKYKRSDGRVLLNTKDGSDDEIIVPDDRVRDFRDYNASYQSGSKWRYDGQEWNDNMKADILGFETTDDMDSYLGGFTTQWSRQNAIDYRQNPTTANFTAMAFSESASQWTDPEKLIMGASIYVGGISARSSLRSTSTLSDIGYTVGAARSGYNKILHFGKIKVSAETFHRQIKPNILSNSGNFSKIVGKNPDVKIVSGKIILQGTGPFRGKSFNSGLSASDYF